MSFDNLFDGLADGPMVCGIKPLDDYPARPDGAARGEAYRRTVDSWIGKICERQITLSPVHAAAYATPAKTPRIIREFAGLYDDVILDYGREGRYLKGKKLLGAVVLVNGVTQCFFSPRHLSGFLKRKPDGIALIAVVYAKCN